MENKIDPKLVTPEMLAKAMACETPEALVSLAKESGVTLTTEEAQKYLAEMENFSVDLSEEDMAKVAGGTEWYECPSLGECMRFVKG